jgi:uncharacterized protein YecE (DUF72 family)
MRFAGGLDPLVEAGRLAALLVQFPESFHADTGARGYLDWLLEALREYPLSVELRHRTWDEDGHATRVQLAAYRASRTLIDQPRGTGEFSTDLAKMGTGGGAILAKSVENSLVPLYFRLHGRNAAEWWHHAAAEDRYNYLYSRAELSPFAEVARRASLSGQRVLMYLNNHFSAKSVANAAVLKHELEQPLPGDYPVEMISRYPELSGVVATSGLPL